MMTPAVVVRTADPLGWSPIVLAGIVGVLFLCWWLLPRRAGRVREFALLAAVGVSYFLVRSLAVPHDTQWGTRPFLGLAVGALIVFLIMPRHVMLARELALLTAAWFVYFLVRGAVVSQPDRAITHAQHLIRFERRLGIFVEPRLQARLLTIPHLATVANWVYVWGHWPVMAGVLLWLARQRPDAYPRYRTAILISGAIGLVIFACYPVAPPRMVPGIGLADTIAAGSHSYRVLQPPSLANPYAALPSLHVGWDFLMGIALARHAAPRPIRVIGGLLPVAMTAAVILTANHYVVDTIAGMSCALIGLWVGTRLQHWRASSLDRDRRDRGTLAGQPAFGAARGD